MGFDDFADWLKFVGFLTAVLAGAVTAIGVVGFVIDGCAVWMTNLRKETT